MRRPGVHYPALLLTLLLPACDATEEQTLTGYLEAETRYIAPETSGRIQRLGVAAGDRVEAGATLFTLDDSRARARAAEARARVGEAHSALEDARTQTQRPQEIAVLEAALDDAMAAREQARRELERARSLHERGAIPESQLDDARTALERREAAVAETERRIDAARLPARESRIRAAEATLARARAGLQLARTELAQHTVAAPGTGVVQEIILRAGEVAGPDRPVVALLPPRSLKVRVFVPEPHLSALSIGTRLGIRCDGCRPGLTATVTFIADEAAFMPPNLLARGQRHRLAFLVEARPEDSLNGLPAGLPVTVVLAGEHRE